MQCKVQASERDVFTASSLWVKKIKGKNAKGHNNEEIIIRMSGFRSVIEHGQGNFCKSLEYP